MGEVLAINMQAPPEKITGGHVHTCPECNDHVPCEMTCSSFTDMDLDDGTPRGAHVVCADCEMPLLKAARPEGGHG